MRWLREERHTTVVDTRADDYQQSQGVDMLVGTAPAEFKADTRIHQTGNIAFEIIANSRRPTIGCLMESVAIYLFYYDTVQNILHIMDLPHLRLALETRATWRCAVTTTPRKNGTAIYATFSLLVPLLFIQQEPSIKYRCYDLSAYAGDI
jgi:hypothetical protein